MNIPDYVSPIIGHRVWQWDGSALVSLNGEFWPPGQALEAECSRSFVRKFEGVQLHGHRAPQMYCSCGIYAAKSSEQLAGLGLRLHGISGEVYLWGTVIEHVSGWRAQFSYPKSLVLSAHTIPFGMDEAKSFLAALTVYSADISLTYNGKKTCLWNKLALYHEDGLAVLRSVANWPIEKSLHVAVFADNEAHIDWLHKQNKSAQTAQVVLWHAVFPLSVTDPVIQQVRERRVMVALVDLDAQNLEECIRAIRVIRSATDVAVLAICDWPCPEMIAAALGAGADQCLARNELQNLNEVLQGYFLLMSKRGRRGTEGGIFGLARRGFVPPGGFSPPGGSIPPTAAVCAPIGRGPRPMRPRAVALAI